MDVFLLMMIVFFANIPTIGIRLKFIFGYGWFGVRGNGFWEWDELGQCYFLGTSIVQKMVETISR
jgi:hypothetical protein